MADGKTLGSFVNSLNDLGDSASSAEVQMRDFLKYASRENISPTVDEFKRWAVETEGLGKSFDFAAIKATALNAAMNVGISVVISAAISGVISLIQWLATSYDRLQESAQQASEEYQNTVSEIEGLNNELITTDQRISELENKDSLTLIEQNELDKLRQTNIELERQIANLKAREQIEQRQSNEENLELFNTIDSGITGSFANQMIKASGVEYEQGNQASYLEYLINEANVAKENLEKLEKSNGNEQEIQIAQNKISTLEDKILTLMESLSSIREGLTDGYSTEVDTAIAEIEAAQQKFRKYSGTETSRDMLLSQYGDNSDAKDYINSLSTEDTDLLANYKGTIDSYEELPDILTEIKSSADETNNSIGLLNETVSETAENANDIFTLLGEASSGIGSLNSAFAEFGENGVLSFSTLKNINEEFANVEGIDDYVNKLSSAELTSEELNSILSELTYKYLEQEIGVENLAEADETLVAKMLEEQGVSNSLAVAHDLITYAKENVSRATETSIESMTRELIQMGLSEEAAKQLATSYVNCQSIMTETALQEAIARLNITQVELQGIQTVAQAYDLLSQKRQASINEAKSTWNVMGDSFAEQAFEDRVTGLEVPTVDEQTVIDYAKQIEDLTNQLNGLGVGSSDLDDIYKKIQNPEYGKNSSGFSGNGAQYSGSSTADGAKKASDALDNYNKSVEDNAEKLSDAEDKYAKAVEDANERRQDAYEKYNDTIADIEERLEELNKEERLANLQYEIELVNQELEKFGDQLSMLDTQIDMSFEGDYVYKLQAIGTQFKVASEYSADLRSEIDKLINTMPANADEANALADQLESLGEQYYENQRAVIEYRKEANDARASMIEEMAELSSQQSDRLSSIIDRSFSIMENGSIVGDFFALPLVGSVSKDAVDRQRDENDRLIEEEKRYREEIAKIRTNATVLEKQEDDAEREKKRAEYQQQALDAKAELDETLASIDETMANAHDTLLSTVSDIETSLNNSFDSYSDSVDGAVQTTKKAINDIINYADSAEISIDVQSYVQSVEDKYNGESIDHKASGGSVSGNAIVNEEGLESVILPDGTFRVLKNGEKMVAHFPRGSHILNARDTSEILKTGIKDGDKIPQYADGSIGYSSISSNSGNRISEIRTSTTTSRKKSKTPGTVIDEILNEIQGAFDNIDVSLDNVKEQVVNEFNDPEWSDEITQQLDSNVVGDYSNDPETGLTSLLLQQSSWDELPESMQTSLSEDLQVTNETWAEWVATPENALIAMQLCREQGVGSWDLLSPTMVEILNTAGINSKTTWDTFVAQNPLQALQLLVSSWDALKAQIQQYIDDMIAIATNGAEAIHAIQIESPDISQESWNNLQTVIANKIQEILNAINETFKENDVDLNFSITTEVSSQPLSGSESTNPQGDGSGSSLVATAKKYLGVPYLWGGTTPSGFDCSGLMQYVYRENGINISRTTYTQVQEGVAVSKENLQPGDLVFFGDPISPHHVGMYIGNGQYLHAPSTGDVVKISNLDSRGDFAAARRIINSYYTGTGGAKSGYATVGDGNAVKGDFKNPAPELIFRKSGGAYLAGLNGTEIVHLDAGDTVVPHEETMRILKNKNASVGSGRFNSYARGTSSNNAQTTDLSSWSADELGRTDLVDIPKLSESQIASLIEQFFSSSGSVVTTSDAYGIYQAQNQTGMSALAILAIGALESGWGTSSIANTKGNLWGWGATNVNPMGNAKTFSSNTGDAAMEYASNFMSLYYDERGAKSIYAVGTGDNPSGLGYAYYDSGGIDSRWFTQVSSIMAQLAHAVDGMGYLYTGNSNRSGSSYNRIYNLILQKLNELVGTVSTNTDTGGMQWSGYKRLSGRQSNYDFDTPFTNLNKRATGGIINDDNTTIVNELGEESVEHADGTIESLGKTPRLYKLRKGDKVYNAKDTAYLKKYLGNNLERAKVQKLASGSYGDMDIVNELPDLTKEQIEQLLTKFESAPTVDDLLNAQSTTGISALAILAIAALESDWGKSPTDNNYWKYGYNENDPYGIVRKYDLEESATQFAEELLSDFYNDYELTTINLIGAGDDDGNIAYDRDSEGNVNTNWAPEVINIISDYVNALDDVDLEEDSDDEDDSSNDSGINYIEEINELLSGDDKVTENSFTKSEIELIYNALQNLRDDEDVTRDQLDQILETEKKLNDIDEWLTTEYEDLLTNIDKNITSEYQLMEADYHFWQEDFSNRFRDFLNNGNHQSPLLGDYFAFAGEAYDKSLDVIIAQSEMAMGYTIGAVDIIKEQLENAYILLQNAVTADEQARVLETIDTLTGYLETHENNYNEYADSIQTALISKIQAADDEFVNAISYENKHIEELDRKLENETDPSKRSDYFDEQANVYQRIYDLADQRAQEAHQRQLDLYNSDNETVQWLLERFKLDEIFDANGDFNSKYEQTLAAINSYIENGEIGSEAVQVFQAMALYTQEDKKISYEANDTMNEMLDAIEDIRDEKIDDLISTYLSIQEEMINVLDFRLNKQNLEYDATSALYDFQQTLEQNKLDAQVELTANKELEQWLDPETRQLLFNDDDYSEYISGIDQINKEIQADYEDYINIINNLTPEESYREAEITAQWERQLEIKQEELEVLQDEMNVAKKTLEYNNAAKERDTQIILGNRVVNVADPENLHNIAMEREELINQASLNQMTHANNSELRNLEALSNVTETQINAIQQRIDMINDMTDAEREAWAKSLPEEDVMNAWLNSFTGTAVRWLNETLTDYTDIISSFTHTETGNVYNAGVDHQAIINSLPYMVEQGLITQEEANVLFEKLNYARNEKTSTSKDYAQYYNGAHPQEYGSFDRELIEEYESSILTATEQYDDITANMQEIIDHGNLHGATLTDDELQQLKDLETQKNKVIIENLLDNEQTSDYGGYIITDAEQYDIYTSKIQEIVDRANSQNVSLTDDELQLLKKIETKRNVAIVSGSLNAKQTSDYGGSIIDDTLVNVPDGGYIKINGVEYKAKNNLVENYGINIDPGTKVGKVNGLDANSVTLSVHDGQDMYFVDKITSGELIPLSEAEIEDKLSSLVLPTVEGFAAVKLDPSIFASTIESNGISTLQRDVSYAYNFGDIIITNPVRDANDIIQELTKKMQEYSTITTNMTMN